MIFFIFNCISFREKNEKRNRDYGLDLMGEEIGEEGKLKGIR